MYIREIQPPRGSPIENGIPIAGTWNEPFAQVDLLDIHRPFAWPCPRWLRDYRIKEWESFSVQDDHFSLEALLGNFKLFQAAEVLLYNKDTGTSYVFRKVLPGNSWRLPKSLNHGVAECRHSHFFFRIHTWLDAETIKLDLDITKTKRQPAFTAHLAFSTGHDHGTPVSVSLNFAERRSMYAFKTFSAVRGDLVLGGEHISLDPARCMGIFRDYKGFYPYRMRGTFCGGMGFDAEGRRYGFHVVENQAKENRKNNENALWVNGQLTHLPPVRITMPNGPESDWVIQDLDGMVDLVFTPKSFNRFRINLLAANSDFFAPMGYYNGMLVSTREEQMQVRNQWGIGEKLYLRM